MRESKTIVQRNINSQTILVVGAVAIASLLAIGLFLYQAHAQFSGQKPNEDSLETTSSGVLQPSAKTGVAPNVSRIKETQMLEIHIANNGLTLLRGAQVIALSRDTIRVITKWDSADFTWEIQTRFYTKFLTSKGDEETLADIRVGDILTVTGILIKGGADPILIAKFLRESQ